jgi:hypothetical protein
VGEVSRTLGKLTTIGFFANYFNARYMYSRDISLTRKDYKWARGFDPAVIHSAHYICHPGLRQAVTQFIDFETETNVELTELLMQKSVIGSGSSGNGSKTV